MLHNRKGEISVADLADYVNALLQTRGAIAMFTAEQIGWKLRELGIARRKRRDHMAVEFSKATRDRIHELVRAFGVEVSPLPDTCSECGRLQVNEK